MTDDEHDPVAGSTDPADPVALRSGREPSDADAGQASSRSGAGVERRKVDYLVPVGSERAGSSGLPGSGAAPVPVDEGSVPVAAGEPGADAEDEPKEREDWAWVQEWRAGQESTPWATGIALAVFSALIAAVAIWVLSAGLADRPVVAILVNLLVAGGLTPAIWLSRQLPVLRWIAAGAAAGIIIGWISAILMLPFPPP